LFGLPWLVEPHTDRCTCRRHPMSSRCVSILVAGISIAVHAPPDNRGSGRHGASGQGAGSTMRDVALPAPFAEVADRVRNWGRWGEDDQIGSRKLIDGAARQRAAAAVHRGKAFALGLPLSESEGIQMGFIEGRVNPSRSMIQVNQPLSPDPDWVCSSEDVVTLALQCATHWDALAHCSYGGTLYNGYPASSVTDEGAGRCGIHLLTTVVSRGILLDVARALGVARLEPGHPISPDELTKAAALARVTPAAGDIALVRTGQMAHLQPPDRDLIAYTWPSPGLTIETAEWFHHHDIAAVAT